MSQLSEELSFDEIATEGMYIHCNVCSVASKCKFYEKDKPKKQCALEPIIYQKHYNDLIEKKGVEAEKYQTEIHNIAMLYVQLFRRTRFEALRGMQEADVVGTSEAGMKIQRIITQKLKALGADRGSDKKHVETITKGRKGDFLGAFISIEKVKKGRVTLKDEQTIIEESKQIIKAVIKPTEKKEITQKDLKFDVLGLTFEDDEIEVKEEIPELPEYRRPRRKTWQ